MKATAHFLTLLGLIAYVQSQSLDLSGRLTGHGGNPLSGASVSLQSSGLTVTTDADGAWSMDSGRVSVQGSRYRVGAPRWVGNAIHFSSRSGQIISWSILDHAGRTVALAEGREYSPGDQRIQLPRLSAGSGIYFFKCVINGHSTVLRFLNIPQVRPGNGAMAASRRPLEKSAVAADTLFFSKTGYINGKMPVVGSGGKYDLRLFKTGGVERFGFLQIVNGMRKIGTCLLNGTDAKMIPTPDVNIEEAAWSPDGRRIAFTTREGIDKDFNWQIYVMNADGGQLQALARGASISWHQNGDWLAWVHFTHKDEPVGQLKYGIQADVKAVEFKDSIANNISLQGGAGAVMVVPNTHSYFDHPKWLPGPIPALVAYHTYTEFTSPTTGFSRHRIYKITKTEPYSSYSIVATAKQDFVLFIPSVLFDGTVIYQRWDGLETSTREKIISNHIWDSSSGERNLEGALYPGINSPNSQRVFRENVFQDVFGGGNRVAAVGLPTLIFAWFIAY